MTVINTNVNALTTQGALTTNSRALANAMQQLSTGKRINSAKDDAAGMAIATRITQQVQALNQAVRNSGDAISLIQTAEGATNEITSMLQRMRELSIQAINDTNANEQRGYLDQEFQQLKQQIVQIANSTEWNGFPILNGTAGQQVGPVPMIRTTGNGQFVPDVQYAVGTPTSSQSGTPTITLSSTGAVAKSGQVSITVVAGTPLTATGVMKLEGGESITLSNVQIYAPTPALTTPGTVIKFTAGGSAFTLTSTSVWAAGNTAGFSINRSFGTLSPIVSGDVTINGKTIPDAKAESDVYSPADNAVGSAIAKTKTINDQSALTGVKAVVGATVMTGSAMSLDALSSSTPPGGSISINGFLTQPFSTVHNNTQASRAVVIEAINKLTTATGVVATDSGGDAGGIMLSAADGRNIQVAFNSTSTDVAFSQATGLKQGAQSGTYSLSASVGEKLEIEGGSGNILHSGLQAGAFNENASEVSTLVRAPLIGSGVPKALRPGDLVINGTAIPGSAGIADLHGDPIPTQNSSSAVSIAAAINSQSGKTGVTATAGAASIAGVAMSSTLAGGEEAADLYINGRLVTPPINMVNNPDDRAKNIVDAIRSAMQGSGIDATYNGSGKGISIITTDGRNLSVSFDKSQFDAADFGLKDEDVGDSTDAATTVTHFGAVNMHSSMPPAPFPLPPSIAGSPVPPPPPTGKIQISTGTNGASAASNFDALGFVAGSYGGASGMDMSSPRIGRLTFQIGASAGQTIGIDFADFGSTGPITGDITKDAGYATPVISIATAAGATAVLASLDKAMNNINDARANMGAVMNRLTHVIDNLNNVVTNSKQSRSQIEDADYAQASTNLARAQIIQQAATAVLAQANTSAQGVLKLLQG